MDYLLFYDYGADYAARRAPFRDEHLALAWAAQAAGTLVLAGVLAPAEGAVFHFRADSPAPVEAFVASDPYVRNGLVTRWRIQAWLTAVGEAAATPIRPSLRSAEGRP